MGCLGLLLLAAVIGVIHSVFVTIFTPIFGASAADRLANAALVGLAIYAVWLWFDMKKKNKEKYDLIIQHWEAGADGPFTAWWEENRGDRSANLLTIDESISQIKRKYGGSSNIVRLFDDGFEEIIKKDVAAVLKDRSDILFERLSAEITEDDYEEHASGGAGWSHTLVGFIAGFLAVRRR